MGEAGWSLVIEGSGRGKRMNLGNGARCEADEGWKEFMRPFWEERSMDRVVWENESVMEWASACICR